MTGVFEVLAEPHRRQILTLLLDGETSVGGLVEAMPLSQPGVSKHLRVLRDAGLVAMRQDAQQRLYRVQLEALLELDSWLAPFRARWRDRLDALAAHLDSMDDEPPTSATTTKERGNDDHD